MSTTTDKRFVILPCDCRCAMMVVERIEWDDGDVDFDISVQDSYYDKSHNSLWGRLRRAAKALVGKPVCFNDVYIQDPDRFRQWVSELAAIADDEGEGASATEGT